MHKIEAGCHCPHIMCSYGMGTKVKWQADASSYTNLMAVIVHLEIVLA
jgi:hypothetical protein